MVPAYQNASIVNLMSSIIGAMGHRPGEYDPLDALPVQDLSAARNVVLLVVDGLGYEFLRRQGNESALKRYLRAPMTSVFPTTTASAVTTFVTGVAPQQHAITGWFTYLKELGSVWAMLPFKPRFSGATVNHNAINTSGILHLETLFQRLDVASYVVTPRNIAYSDFSLATTKGAKRLPYESLPQMFERLEGVVHAQGRRKYVYAYWPEFDAIAHQHGVASAAASNHFNVLDRAFGDFVEAVAGTDTTVIVTADHGLIDCEPQSIITLDEHPELEQTLALPLCGEPRTAYCYVREGQGARFEAYVEKHLADVCSCYRSETLVQQGYFGLHAPHPRLYQRVGDYTLIMKDNFVIKDYLLGEAPFSQVGVHGGVTEDEMRVPLIVAQL